MGKGVINSGIYSIENEWGGTWTELESWICHSFGSVKKCNK